ncbi:MAG: ABC transporter permease [Planctomycetes bacterium]|nr:ABC transporter permease [Planctomycetota bacterium]
MKFGDLLREASRALRASPSRTVLTALGIIVGTMALTLILSLSLGLARVIDDLVASDEQLRHVVVMPGFGRQASDGRSTPTVAGEMDDLKRQRLQRTLLKRSRGGPPFQMRSRVIDADTETWLRAMPGIEQSRAFLQERFEVSLVPTGDAPAAATAPDDPSAPKRPPMIGLTLGAPAEHPYYPGRVIAGRWFKSDDEKGVVVHEILLWKMGLTSDDAQKALVGRTVHFVARKAAGGLAGMFFGGGAGPSNAPVAYELDLPILGVIRERFGEERATVIEEAWAMQADMFVAQGFARELWDKQPGRGGPQSMLLVARDLADVERIEKEIQERGLEVRTVREAVEGLKKGLSIVTVVASVLAGIALFVSALGIVNTLVMSVLERTREIGLLKALGATDGDVASIFLVEAGLLGLGGGVLGAALGFGLALVGDVIGRRMVEETFLMPFKGNLFQFPWWLALGALGFALVTSLLAAVLPTLRAARIDPVKALRHE